MTELRNMCLLQSVYFDSSLSQRILKNFIDWSFIKQLARS